MTDSLQVCFKISACLLNTYQVSSYLSLISHASLASPFCFLKAGICGYNHSLQAITALFVFPSLPRLEPCSKELSKYSWKKSLFLGSSSFIYHLDFESQTQKPMWTTETQFIARNKYKLWKTRLPVTPLRCKTDKRSRISFSRVFAFYLGVFPLPYCDMICFPLEGSSMYQ